jgi:hypothetical protein
MKDLVIQSIESAVKKYPAVIPYLTGRARWIAYTQIKSDQIEDVEVKTYDFYLSTLERLIRSVYVGLLDGEFIDIMANLVQGQITQAYEQSWVDDGNFLPMPSFMQTAANNAILGQYNYIDQLFRDIVDARVDNLPLDKLLYRAQLWAKRYEEAYNNGKLLIALEMGGKLKWVLGATERHCKSCAKLDGTVDYANEWLRSGVQPQNAPNNYLQCQGWNCDCKLIPTEERRTYGGLAKLGY